MFNLFIYLLNSTIPLWVSLVWEFLFPWIKKISSQTKQNIYKHHSIPTLILINKSILSWLLALGDMDLNSISYDGVKCNSIVNSVTIEHFKLTTKNKFKHDFIENFTLIIFSYHSYKIHHKVKKLQYDLKLPILNLITTYRLILYRYIVIK